MATGVSGGRKPGGGRATAINIDQVHLEHCMQLVHRWHDLRSDFEDKLHALTGDNSILSSRNGTYMPDVFNGHCQGDGNDFYNLLAGKDESFERVHELYN